MSSQLFYACNPSAEAEVFSDVVVGAANLTPGVISSLGWAGAGIAIVACLYFTRAVLVESLGYEAERGKERELGLAMERIRKMIYEGALQYLNTQCTFALPFAEGAPVPTPSVVTLSFADMWLAVWVAILFVLISCILGPVTAPNTPYDGPLTGFAFVIGAFLSAAAGYIGKRCCESV